MLFASAQVDHSSLEYLRYPATPNDLSALKLQLCAALKCNTAFIRHEVHDVHTEFHLCSVPGI